MWSSNATYTEVRGRQESNRGHPDQRTILPLIARSVGKRSPTPRTAHRSPPTSPTPPAESRPTPGHRPCQRLPHDLPTQPEGPQHRLQRHPLLGPPPPDGRGNIIPARIRRQLTQQIQNPRQIPPTPITQIRPRHRRVIGPPRIIGKKMAAISRLVNAGTSARHAAANRCVPAVGIGCLGAATHHNLRPRRAPSSRPVPVSGFRQRSPPRWPADCPPRILHERFTATGPRDWQNGVPGNSDQSEGVR